MRKNNNLPGLYNGLLIFFIFIFPFIFIGGCDKIADENKSPVEYLHTNSDLYQQVSTGNKLVFPRDHWPHPDFHHEWWYLNASLTTNSGQLLAAQWTLFRTSANKRHFYFAHAALADEQQHHSALRHGRVEFNNVSITQHPFSAVIDDWSWQSKSELLPATLTFGNEHQQPQWQAMLELTSTSPFFLQGQQGYSQKHPQPDIASYYYSQPFINVSGRVFWQGQWQKVSGNAWFDREWGSKMLGPDQLGWDWFSLRLTKSTTLMIYRLRSNLDDYISGSIMHKNGDMVTLSAADIELNTLNDKKQPYPVGFILSIPTQAINIELHTINKKQLMSFGIEYFEGMVSFSGSHQGRGFLEMTGYR